MLIIAEVEPGGLGATVGLRTGDRISHVNGFAVMDVIDFQVHTAERQLVLEVEREGERYDVEVVREAGESFGVDFGDLELRRCNNNCVFCFIDQMPPGMRPSLYVKDDDFRLSFLHGSYVTLTNLNEEDIQRIAAQRLSPQYLSVHAVDPELRQRLLGRRRPPPDILDQIQQLADQRIEMHTQVVLCPGWNDGDQLAHTVAELSRFYPAVRSVALVPVGLTRFREELPSLTPVTPSRAATYLDFAEEQGVAFLATFGERFVYGADELFLIAGRPIPAQQYYHGFPQLENGVGMARAFLDAWEAGREALSKVSGRGCIGLVTGELAARFMGPVVNEIGQLTPLQARMIVVRNRFFGSKITVSGLLTGHDMVASLGAQPELDAVFLPPNCLNSDGYTLDGYSVPELSARARVPVFAGDYDLAKCLHAFLRSGASAAAAGRQLEETGYALDGLR